MYIHFYQFNNKKLVTGLHNYFKKEILYFFIQISLSHFYFGKYIEFDINCVKDKILKEYFSKFYMILLLLFIIHQTL